MKDNLAGHDALSLGALVAQGELHPLELVEAVVSRIEQVNPKLNAVIHTLYDRARARAEEVGAILRRGEAPPGPFCGVPFLLKDLIAECEGSPLNEGCRALKGYVSNLDSELVTRQKASGLIIVGKTNTPEFGALPTTQSVLFGATSNPWNPNIMPGGSSGGSAAAVASRVVPLAHGNDTGGSLRVPASACGVFGFKPTRGRNPLGPLFGDMISGLTCEHAVSLTVRDSAALLDATSGPDTGDPYWASPKKQPFLQEVKEPRGKARVGLLRSIPNGWHAEAGIHPDCLEALDDAAKLCEHLGHHVEEIDPEDLAWPRLYRTFGLMWSCAVGHMIQYWESEIGRQFTEKDLEPMNWLSYRAGLKRTGADYLRTLEEIQRFSRKAARLYLEKGLGVILSPTLRMPPAEAGVFTSTPDDPMRILTIGAQFLALTYAYNLTGQPAMSVPLFWNREGIPIGVQFAAPFGRESVLFRLASQLEEERPWFDRIPPIHAAEIHGG